MNESSSPKLATTRACTLHVCLSCRAKHTPREPRDQREGFLFHQELMEAFAASPLRDRVRVVPAECLSICPRPCGFALSSPGAWTYLFGDQQLGTSAQDILACVLLYLDAPDGFMARADRPETLRAGVLGRVPPSPEEATCI